MNVEVLAPVGDEKNFYMAIFNGANAIYLGLKDFNARNKATNFDCNNIRQYVEIAHLYNVKVYVTVNTILIDEELKLLLEMVKKCVEAKVDAFIVQDFGVATLLKNTFKGIILHASTQMGIHSLEGALIAEQMGFKRIVLSRETQKEDIIKIKQNTNLEIEYFVHGALCVCFSGNCYYSSLEKNESGNRGRCLQLCRLPLKANVKEKIIKKGYLLSTTDLCLYKQVKELKELGICSFKIEGRLRRPAYVAQVTRAYVNILKGIEEETLENFKKLFFRGEYNQGWYLNRSLGDNIINTNYQNHRGVLVGSVSSIKSFKDIYEVEIITNGYELKVGDGLKFVDKNGESGLGVGSVKKGKKQNEFIVYTKAKAKVGAEVYLTVDSTWEKQQEEKLCIPYSAFFEAKVGKKPLLKVSARGVDVSVVLFESCQKAINQPLQENDIKETLLKTGDTFFALESVKADVESVFVPKSALNELRRQALEKLKNKLIENFENTNSQNILIDNDYYFAKSNTKEECKAEKFVVIDEYNLDTTKQKGETIVFSPQNFCCAKKHLQQLLAKTTKKIFINLPKLVRGEDIEELKNIVLSFSPKQLGVVANNISQLYFTQLGYEVIGGVYLNIANSFSQRFLNELGVKFFVKSFEGFANNFNKGLTFVGKPALMTFCHCPYKVCYNNKDCKNCNYNGDLYYSNQSGKSMKIRRIKIINCTFEMLSNEIINKDKIKDNNIFLDMRS